MMKCLICDQPFQQSPHHPFCSAKCKMVDLGHWFNEDYVIADSQGDSESEEE